MDLNLIYRAVASGEIDVTAGDATSGLIRALDLVILQDDREYFPPYDAVPVVRTATLLRYPEADRAIRALAGRITADDMQRLNHEVDGLRQRPTRRRRGISRRPLTAHRTAPQAPCAPKHPAHPTHQHSWHPAPQAPESPPATI